jgi:TRAP-type C4-dicarboxylate transport system permease small subunit
VDRIVERLMQAIARLLTGLFVFAVLLAFANVVARYVFSTSIPAADEVEIYIMIWMTFLGGAVVTRRHMHLRMDVLAAALPWRAQYVLQLAEQVILIGVAGFAVVPSAQYVATTYQLGIRSDGAQIPMWIPHGALLVGLSLIALLAFLRLVAIARHPEKARPAGFPVEGAAA